MTERKLSETQIEEWTDNPVTKELKRLVNKYLNSVICGFVDDEGEIRNPYRDAFHSFDPQRTQETIASIEGAADTWEEIIELLEGNWELIDEE